MCKLRNDLEKRRSYVFGKRGNQLFKDKIKGYENGNALARGALTLQPTKQNVGPKESVVSIREREDQREKKHDVGENMNFHHHKKIAEKEKPCVHEKPGKKE